MIKGARFLIVACVFAVLLCNACGKTELPEAEGTPLLPDTFPEPRSGTTPEVQAIEEVLHLDAAAAVWIELKAKQTSSLAAPLHRMVQAMAEMDTSKCPTDFREAYVRHCSAWRAMYIQVASEPGQTIMDIANLVLRKGNGTLPNIAEDRKKKAEQVLSTWTELEVVAVRHGANTQAATRQIGALRGFTFPVIIEVQSGSLAEKFGIQTDDVFLEYDGVSMHQEREQSSILQRTKDEAKTKEKQYVRVKLLGPKGIKVIKEVPAGEQLGILYWRRK